MHRLPQAALALCFPAFLILTPPVVQAQHTGGLFGSRDPSHVGEVGGKRRFGQSLYERNKGPDVLVN
jgi:hypothetical protein